MMAHISSNNAADMANNNQVSSSAGLNPMIKIKQEKIDLEVENKICLIKQNIKGEPPDITDTIERPNGNTKSKNVSEESDDDYDDSTDSDSSSLYQNDENESDKDEDDKKHIEPVKSSNEILTELFNVFNAAPPEELLDDKNLIKKAKKDRKEKKKKYKKQKIYGTDVDAEHYEALTGDKVKHKKSKKKHKHKSKGSSKTREKDNEKNRIKDKERAGSKEEEKSKIVKKSNESDRIRERDRRKEEIRSIGRAKSKDRDRIPEDFHNKHNSPLKLSTEHKRHHTKDDEADSVHKRKKTEDKDMKSNTFSDVLRDSERSEKEQIRNKSESREKKSRRYSEELSDLSISDEECSLKEKETRSGYSKRKEHNSFYHSLNRSRSRDKERDHNWRRSKDNYRDRERDRGRDRDRDRNRDGSYRSRGFSRRYQSRYSRSRSRSRSHDLGIDKKRLLEIARKNAISMFKRGNLPGCDNMSQEIRDKVLLKMRYGGRTVEDLTAFCKKISNGENLSGLSSDEDSDVDKAGNTKAFHHPFQLKEREPIVMHIRNSKPILPALANTQEQAKAITMQFPVSSGQQHRMTEHWVPVESKDNLAPLPVLPAASQSTAIFKSNVAKNALGKPLPITEEQEPAFKPIPTQNTETQVETSSVSPTPVVAEVGVPSDEPTNVTSPASASQNVPTNPVPEATQPFVPDVPVPSANCSVFPQTSSSALDVSSIISKRLNAMRRLQENPLDSEAIKMMYSSQKEMSSWASSKYLPGQFTGSTGANVLKPNELNSGYQVWARKDQLTSTKPVTGGMGMQLLQKMGWRPGEGLGREKNGSLQPLLLDVKLDKRGLVSQEECNRKGVPIKRRAASQCIQLAQQSLEEKHPVCLLNELTSKRKWSPPLYTLVNENGPSHSKMFLFSVQVNGKTFTPEKACNTKKEAKMIAAKFCLQQIGILPNC